MPDKARNGIRKGERGFALVADIDIASFVAFYELNWHRRKLVSWHDSSAYFRIYDAAKARDAIKLLAVRAPSGALAAAIMLVWDDRRMYYLQSTRDPAHSDNTAVAYLILGGIQPSPDGELNLQFDR